MSNYTVTHTDIPGLLDKWYKRIRESQFSHYEAEKYYSKKRDWLGIPATVLSAFAGTTILSTLGSPEVRWLQVLVGLASLAAAALSALQTFLRYSERADKHLNAAAKYGSLRRTIEKLKTFLASGIEIIDLPREIEDLKERIDALAENSPNVPDAVWEKAKNKLGTEAQR